MKDVLTTVFVRSLPYDATDAALEEHFSEAGPVRSAFVVKDRATQQGRGFGFVTFALPEDAAQAVSTMGGSLFQGRRLALDLAKSGAEAAASGHKRKAPPPTNPPPLGTVDSTGDVAPDRSRISDAAPFSSTKSDAAPASSTKPAKVERPFRPVNPKLCRLIVRNLSFKSDEAALRTLFETQGTVTEVHVPMRPNGKHPGFGFVQMATRDGAAAAIKSLNETLLLGRTMAVDSALSKDEYSRKAGEAEAAEAEAAEEAAEAEAAGEGEEGSEDEGEEDEGEEDEGSEDEGGAPSAAAGGGSAAGGKPAIEQGCTLFVRGLPIETSEVELKARFVQFGPVRYASIVRDQGTRLSRGNGFVCFVRPEDAAAALAAGATGATSIAAAAAAAATAAGKARGGKPAALGAIVGAAAGGLWLGGRQLQLCEAMDKEGAARAQEERQMAAKDKGPGRRNLHLARLGLQAGEAADSELPQAERERRELAWKAKKEKLSNPNFIVSATRLSVRSLPPAINEDQLRAMALEAAGTAQKRHGPAKLRQVKLVRDNERTDARGEARSRGFGFVEFAAHEHALACLKALADSTSYLQKLGFAGRMLLVEFAADNVQQLKVHEQRIARGKKQEQHDARAVKEAAKKERKEARREQARASLQPGVDEEEEAAAAQQGASQQPPPKKKGRETSDQRRKRQRKQAAQAAASGVATVEEPGEAAAAAGGAAAASVPAAASAPAAAAAAAPPVAAPKKAAVPKAAAPPAAAQKRPAAEAKRGGTKVQKQQQQIAAAVASAHPHLDAANRGGGRNEPAEGSGAKGGGAKRGKGGKGDAGKAAPVDDTGYNPEAALGDSDTWAAAPKRRVRSKSEAKSEARFEALVDEYKQKVSGGAGGGKQKVADSLSQWM
jgi:nucleolar protein 4